MMVLSCWNLVCTTLKLGNAERSMRSGMATNQIPFRVIIKDWEIKSTFHPNESISTFIKKIEPMQWWRSALLLAHPTSDVIDVCSLVSLYIKLAISRPVVPGCAGCAMAHPDFGRSVNPISPKSDRLRPPNQYWHTRIFRPSDGPDKQPLMTFQFRNLTTSCHTKTSNFKF